MLGKAALLVSCLATSVVSADPGTPMTTAPHDLGHALGDDATLSLARLTAAFDVHLVEPAVVDRLVQWNLGTRDFFHGALDSLSSVSVALAARIAPPPDLSILTTDPLREMATNQSSGFGWRDDPIHHDTRYHSGTDFRSKPGTPVVVAGDGKVTFCGRQGGYGNVIYVDHGGGVTTRYAHLSRIEVAKDATLTAGQEIGKVGSTGRATGPHLHFEVRIDGHAVSPILAMSIGDLQRQSPEAGQIAAYALSPELAARTLAGVDHPRSAPPEPKGKKPASRPDRPGRVKRPVAQT